jgi:hypothetical protein
MLRETYGADGVIMPYHRAGWPSAHGVRRRALTLGFRGGANGRWYGGRSRNPLIGLQWPPLYADLARLAHEVPVLVLTAIDIGCDGLDVVRKRIC